MVKIIQDFISFLNLKLLPSPTKKEVYIVGGGYSLRNKNLMWLQNKDTICVNKSIFYVPAPTYFISMDYTFFGKIKRQLSAFLNIPAVKYFVINFAHPNIKEIDGKIIDTRWGSIRYNSLDKYAKSIRSYKRKGIGLSISDFRNGGNSGFCALQLAVLLGYKKIYLVGIDLQVGRKTHFHGGYGESKNNFAKKLDRYFYYFRLGLKELKEKAPDIEVYSCSEVSKLNELIPYKKI